MNFSCIAEKLKLIGFNGGRGGGGKSIPSWGVGVQN